ncbi:MAG: hypothetical protein EHM91_08705 [Planctomycetota bacterium]|nr:MAG: hypothetical protein EHM91_08705 [Planctomycetota bacterium]
MRCAWMTVALLAVGGCTVKVSGKASTPAWKMYKVEHAQPVPSESIRSGPIELRINQVFLEEHKTVLAVSHWTARVRATIVSSERVPVESLSGAFTVTGRSGKVYPAHVSTVGPGRSTWQHQEHTGQPTHLPANVPGEIDVFTQVGDDKSHDALAAFTFRSVRVTLAP